MSQNGKNFDHFWYYKTSTLIVGFLFIGPFILPLAWFNPRYSMKKRILMTGIILVLTVILVLFAFSSLDYYSDFLNLS